MPYRIYLYILTQMISTGKAEAFFAGRNIEFILDPDTGKWIVSSPLFSEKKMSKQVLREFFPGQCKARFTSKDCYLFLENGEALYLRQEIPMANRYALFREIFSSYLKEAEDWRTIFSS
jgi:hypothetical protein